ncbi:hypothetical protein PPL_09455 [Heterostelium album PN500]|uniref:Snurportin-1 n=1 Tax=Heterostelium pallidum (strain ATCC 26659 / Pp 5 / PN500) TaxID=670386 RepID=D3BPI6_HETP5|nr:hypothetical protein PPL_09455 [Heterostelium album PN500]EFA76704.1 hypothetical protein PPL_09455 [Heterostelium album PN500]|eukprot:XP_020428836.1 hypothetical protein PPL_09455 [Heterostelium album PN500]
MDGGQELQPMGSSKKSNEDGVLLSALFGATQFKDVDHEFSHRQQSFKSTISTPESQKRREYYLEKQKLKRRDLVNQLRSVVSDSQNYTIKQQQQQQDNNNDIAIDEQNNDNSINDSLDLNDSMEVSNIDSNSNNNNTQKNRDKRKKQKEKKQMKEISHYSNHLMLAESMTDIPMYFSDEWFAVPVSQGKRCLVISQREITVARSPDGHVMSTFHSTLPFGSPASRESTGNVANRYCILDCLYEPFKSVYYILDILCWKGNMLCDCDTEFRFFWKQTKLAETTASTRSNYNPHPFISLPSYGCDLESLDQLNQLRIQSHQTPEPTTTTTTPINDKQYPIEFILFYHKESHYDFGSTPLLLSLSSHHLPDLVEKLKIDSNSNMDNKNN